MITNIYTIGVYGQTEEEFFSNLVGNGIDTFCDIRRRRAVRGSTYSFVNSKRLQNRLKDLGIKYFHFLELSPSKEIREEQKQVDKNVGIAKRKREELSPTFINAYEKECLCNFNSEDFFKELGETNQKIVLFCVEQAPNACHRSLLANKLAKDLQLKIVHL